MATRFRDAKSSSTFDFWGERLGMSAWDRAKQK
jgi:hypothetical protein